MNYTFATIELYRNSPWAWWCNFWANTSLGRWMELNERVRLLVTDRTEHAITTIHVSPAQARLVREMLRNPVWWWQLPVKDVKELRTHKGTFALLEQLSWAKELGIEQAWLGTPLLAECLALSEHINHLPSDLQLGDNDPLLLLLHTEMGRLSRLLEELETVPLGTWNRGTVKPLIDEFTRIDAVLHSGLGHVAFTPSQQKILHPFSEEVQRVCDEYFRIAA